MQNHQPIEKRLEDHRGGALDVHSIFATIQGEGPLAGRTAIFIRLAGCNLQCPSCDTDYTHGRKQMSMKEIETEVSRQALQYRIDCVVITGGEPFRQNITPLCDMLLQGIDLVQVESNGSLPPSPNLNQRVKVVCSPKTGKVNPLLVPYIVAWKYVVSGDNVMHDGLPLHALNHPCTSAGVARPRNGSPVFVQPQDDKDPFINKANMRAAVDSCMQHGHRLCIQMHKYADLE